MNNDKPDGAANDIGRSVRKAVTAPTIVQQIEVQWRCRRRAQGYEPGTAACQRAEFEFFVGAMAAMQALTGDANFSCPPRWVIAGLRGDPIVT